MECPTGNSLYGNLDDLVSERYDKRKRGGIEGAASDRGGVADQPQWSHLIQQDSNCPGALRLVLRTQPRSTEIGA